LFVTTALDGTPFVKVLDFGVSKLLSPKKQNVALTRPGQAVGTLEYMAPERLEMGAVIDPRADIWSLGVILFEIITATSLFAAPTVGELATNIRSMEIPKLSSKRSDAMPELDMVLLRCLARNKEARYPDVGALAAALAPFAPAGAAAFAERIAKTMERARDIPFLTDMADAPLVPDPSDAAVAPPPRPSQRMLAKKPPTPAPAPVTSSTAQIEEIPSEPLTKAPMSKQSVWSTRRVGVVAIALGVALLIVYAITR
jgi:serine/threonine-protein kinase